ncbi:FAD/NAD(P)-binding oxidoreductase [Streptomyces libani]
MSKQVLAGSWEPERTVLRQEADLQRLKLDLRLGCRATGLDPAARTVTLADGDRLRYDGLLLATGLRPRRLPFGHDLAGVHVLRTLDDALTLRAQLGAGPRVVVIGAGFLGSEIAATARGLGLDVSLVDTEPTPLARQVGTFVGGLVADLHRDHGVRLHMGHGVTEVTGARGRVTAVLLDDGTRLPADVVVVAIGSVPAVDWLAGSGLPLGDGVRCDSHCRAAPGVYAAGDVANWPDPATGGRVRLEQRMNATEQARAAVRNLLAGPGDAVPYTPVPFGWTDQYDAKIQFHGSCPADARGGMRRRRSRGTRLCRALPPPRPCGGRARLEPRPRPARVPRPHRHGRPGEGRLVRRCGVAPHGRGRGSIRARTWLDTGAGAALRGSRFARGDARANRRSGPAGRTGGVTGGVLEAWTGGVNWRSEEARRGGNSAGRWGRTGVSSPPW